MMHKNPTTNTILIHNLLVTYDEGPLHPLGAGADKTLSIFTLSKYTFTSIHKKSQQ